MRYARSDYASIQTITTNGTTRQIPDGEPVFLLRGQDVCAADTVREWARRVEQRGGDPEIIRMAREHADKMDTWPVKKLPDLPKKGKPAQEHGPNSWVHNIESDQAKVVSTYIRHKGEDSSRITLPVEEYVGLIRANAELGNAATDWKIRVDQLEEDARKFYLADGTCEVMPSVEAVVERRKACALKQEMTAGQLEVTRKILWRRLTQLGTALKMLRSWSEEIAKTSDDDPLIINTRGDFLKICKTVGVDPDRVQDFPMQDLSPWHQKPGPAEAEYAGYRLDPGIPTWAEIVAGIDKPENEFEKIIFQCIGVITTHPRYSHMAPEEAYEKILNFAFEEKSGQADPPRWRITGWQIHLSDLGGKVYKAHVEVRGFGSYWVEIDPAQYDPPHGMQEVHAYWRSTPMPEWARREVIDDAEEGEV